MPDVSERRRLLERHRESLGRGGAVVAEMIGAPVETSAEGAVIVCDDGRELVDCGGYSVFLLGHGHPTVVEAVVNQVRRRALASRVLIDPVTISAASDLVAMAPEHLRRVKFANSGAEATEIALKLARQGGHRHVIAADGGYHGKTLGALSVTPTPKYQDPFQPLFETHIVPFDDTASLAETLEKVPLDSAAFIVEPVQGEGGVRIPDPSYLADVRRVCDAFGALLIVDEIQTGLGRCGSLWAHPPDAKPDIMLVGKALSGGVVPCAATLATESVFGNFENDPGLHSSTFAGSPIQAAAISAALRVVREDMIPSKAEITGRYLMEGLAGAAAASGSEIVRHIRGMGVLIGIEFAEPGQVAEMMAEMLRRNVITNHSLNQSTVLRLTPPAELDRVRCDCVIAAFSEALAEVALSHHTK